VVGFGGGGVGVWWCDRVDGVVVVVVYAFSRPLCFENKSPPDCLRSDNV